MDQTSHKKFLKKYCLLYFLKKEAWDLIFKLFHS